MGVCNRSIFDIPPGQGRCQDRRIRRWKNVASNDEDVLQQLNLNLPSLVAKVDRLVGTAWDTVDRIGPTSHMSALDGLLQFHSDDPRNCETSLDQAADNFWQGRDPFAGLPEETECSCCYKMQAPVIDGDRVFVVATMFWDGSKEVNLFLTHLI